MKLNIPPFEIKEIAGSKLKKSIDSPFIKETFEGDVIFNKTEGKDLINKYFSGEYKAFGAISKQCGETLFEKNCYIKHASGEIDLSFCEFEKKISLVNPLDCVVLSDLNIFDYPGSFTNTVRGTIEAQDYSDYRTAYLRLKEDGTIDLSKDYLLSFLAPIQDRSAEGWFIQALGLLVVSNTSGNYDVSLYVRYVRNKDSIKHSEKWLPIPNSSLFYFQFENASFDSTEYNLTDIIKVVHKGSSFVVPSTNNVKISNTYRVNDILDSIFECSGYTVVSNFFGINSDNTNPNNSIYQYAAEYCYNIKICQSYDVIKENATQDSFAQSGKIAKKRFLTNLAGLFGLFIIPDQTASIIRIEHNCYFARKSFDARNLQYKLSKLKINERETDKEVFAFAAETPSPGFYKVEVTYESPDLYRRENIESPIEIDLFITDVFATLNNLDYAKDDFKKLFFLMSCDNNNNIIEFNRHLSMKSIFQALHQFRRPYRTGKVSGAPMLFSNFSAGLSGSVSLNSSVLGWDILQPLHSITLNEGTFQIEETEIDQNNQLTIKIRK